MAQMLEKGMRLMAIGNISKVNSAPERFKDEISTLSLSARYPFINILVIIFNKFEDFYFSYIFTFNIIFFIFK